LIVSDRFAKGFSKSPDRGQIDRVRGFLFTPTCTLNAVQSARSFPIPNLISYNRLKATGRKKQMKSKAVSPPTEPK
jgi:hypothetical protein